MPRLRLRLATVALLIVIIALSTALFVQRQRGPALATTGMAAKDRMFGVIIGNMPAGA